MTGPDFHEERNDGKKGNSPLRFVSACSQLPKFGQVVKYTPI